MFSVNKNIIVGESCNLFACSPPRFLISHCRHPELVSGPPDKSGGQMLKQVQHDVMSVLFFLMFFSNVSFALNLPGDSAKNKYDINDPRNPHCPCHQYQKVADEEYARLQGSQKDKTINFVKGESKSNDVNFGKQNGSVNSFWFYHKKRKLYGKNPKARGHRKMKYKISDKLSRCFHF